MHVEAGPTCRECHWQVRVAPLGAIDQRVIRDVGGARFPGDICSKLVSAGDSPLLLMVERRLIG